MDIGPMSDIWFTNIFMLFLLLNNPLKDETFACVLDIITKRLLPNPRLQMLNFPQEFYSTNYYM